MIVGGLTDVLLRAADNRDVIFCLPGPENCFEPNAQFAIDGFTEKVMIQMGDNFVVKH